MPAINKGKSPATNSVKENIPTAEETPQYAARSTKEEMEMEAKIQTEKGLLELGKLQQKIAQDEDTSKSARLSSAGKEVMSAQEFSDELGKISKENFSGNFMNIVLKTQQLITQDEHNRERIASLREEVRQLRKDLLSEKDYGGDLKTELDQSVTEINDLETEQKIEKAKTESEILVLKCQNENLKWWSNVKSTFILYMSPSFVYHLIVFFMWIYSFSK